MVIKNERESKNAPKKITRAFYPGGSLAHNKYLKRRKRPLELDKNVGLRNKVIKFLKRGWSPGQIEGYLKLHNYQSKINICYNKII